MASSVLKIQCCHNFSWKFATFSLQVDISCPKFVEKPSRINNFYTKSPHSLNIWKYCYTKMGIKSLPLWHLKSFIFNSTSLLTRLLDWEPSAARSPLYFTLMGLSASIFVKRLDPIELQHSIWQPISSHYNYFECMAGKINKQTVLPDKNFKFQPEFFWKRPVTILLQKALFLQDAYGIFNNIRQHSTDQTIKT